MPSSQYSFQNTFHISEIINQLTHSVICHATVISVGTNFRKTSTCFVQWRETDGGKCIHYILQSISITAVVHTDGGWGLNFVSESDAAKFLDECSVSGCLLCSDVRQLLSTPQPPTLTPISQQLRHTFSTLSLSLPVPEPPAINGEVQLNSSLTDLME